MITFTPDEAMANGYCEGMHTSIQEVLAEGGFENAETLEYTSTFIDQVIELLLTPVVSGALIMLLVGGVWWEIKTPGMGIPTVVALTAGALYFGPHYMEGLAEYWEIGLFLVGVILLVVEIFITPGFGVPGILGITFMVTGLAVTMVKNVGLNFTAVPGIAILEAFAMVLLALATSILGVIWVVKKFIKMKRLHPIVDTSQQNIEEGYTSLDSSLKTYVGLEGKALTDLYPSGFIEVEGKRLDAMSEGGFIEKDTKVQVIELRSTALIVRESRDSESESKASG